MRLSFMAAACDLALSCVNAGCDAPGSESDAGEWVPLFNGTDLSGWDTYLGSSKAVTWPRPASAADGGR